MKGSRSRVWGETDGIREGWAEEGLLGTRGVRRAVSRRVGRGFQC